MTGSWRPRASPRCWIRLRVWREDGAEEVDGRAGVLAEAIAAAREANLLRCRSLPASALRDSDAERGRGSQGTDRPARRAADVADGSHARAAPVPRRGQAARLLSRQGRRHDRRRARRAVRTALCLSEGAMPRPTCARSWRWRSNTRSRSPATTTPPRRTSPTRSATALRSRNFRPRSRPRAACTRPASAS